MKPANAPTGTQQTVHVVRLYVSSALQSTGIKDALDQVFQRALGMRYELTVNDIMQAPDRAESERLFACPTIEVEAPDDASPRRFVGTCPDPDRLAHVLGIPGASTIPQLTLRPETHVQQPAVTTQGQPPRNPSRRDVITQQRKEARSRQRRPV
jgi:hypothetical protein